LDSRSLWLDEAFSVSLAARPVDEILAYRDFHPPLYYLLLRAWTGLGSWFAGDAGVRLPSALASALGVGLSVWLVQRLRLPGPGLVGLLAATNALSVWYAQEARMFALAGLFVLGAVAALAVLTSQARCHAALSVSSTGLWLAYVAATTVAIYLGYDALVVLAVTNLGFLWLTRRGPRWVAALLVANGLVAVLYLPQLGRLMESLAQVRTMELGTRATTVGGASVAALATVCALLSIVWLTPRLPRSARALPALGVLAALDLIELTSLGTSVKRHLAVALPLLLLATGVALAWAVSNPWGRVAIAMAGLPALVAVLFLHPKEEWRRAGAFLTCAVRPDDAIVVYEGYAQAPLRRYFSPPVRMIGVDGPRSAAVAAQALGGRARVWLVESHADDPPTVAPQIADGRRLSDEAHFNGVQVRRFDSPDAAPETPCDRPRLAS
jgi:uncharacterized membrane protein